VDASLVPVEITARLMEFPVIADAILENKWLFILLILMKVLHVDASASATEGRGPLDLSRPAKVF
jgi:hypothetical protein